MDIPSLAHRRRRGDMIYTLGDFFKISQRTTRGHHYKIYKEHETKSPRMNSFPNRIINDWNGLTPEIVSATSTNSVKNKLDNKWKERMYDTPF